MTKNDSDEEEVDDVLKELIGDIKKERREKI